MSATFLESIVQPFSELLTVEAAKKVVSIRADAALQERVDELAEKANLAQLSAAEQAEYDGYLAAFHFVTLLQAKARRLLQS